MGLFTRTKRPSTSSSAASTAPNSGSTTPTTINTNTSTSTLSTSPPTTLSTSPTSPLTKTSSRLSLTKTLTWGKKYKEDKYRRRIESWEREDENEWSAPTLRKGRKIGSKKEQEVLRAFEWKVRRSSLEGGPSRSCFSGISPMCSRLGSMDIGRVELGSSGLAREESETESEGSEVGAGSRE
ncbi:hypothetical protein VTL71DRAFT_8795 [Oculimacula yallundae]|uniref:Uncharacterized protein n=1 Tax=Oculimacula yallundae TaxID=86028 RepID=A0ABR4CYU7_9HELO